VKVLVDTPVWSVAFRRAKPAGGPSADALARLIADDDAVMIGPVRQELLSGVRDGAAFDRLRRSVRAFSDLPIVARDYEIAARCFNACRSRGIQGSNTDFLICAVALRHQMQVFTTDRDFESFARVLPISLYAAGN
jgi:predicted nucleic acid-binding protein